MYTETTTSCRLIPTATLVSLRSFGFLIGIQCLRYDTPICADTICTFEQSKRKSTQKPNVHALAHQWPNVDECYPSER